MYLTIHLEVENTPTLSGDSLNCLTAYYHDSIPAPHKVSQLYRKEMHIGVPRTIVLNIQKRRTVFSFDEGWFCYVMGASIKDCLAELGPVVSEMSKQLSKRVTYEYTQEKREPIDKLIRIADRRKKIKTGLYIVITAVVSYLIGRFTECIITCITNIINAL